MVVGLLMSAVVVWQASSAVFTATTSNGSNSFSTGTVVLSSTPVSTVFTVPNLKPGATGSACIRVTYSGTIDASIRLYGASLTSTNGLASYVSLEIEQTTGAGTVTAPSCTGFGTSFRVFDFSMSALVANASNYATGLGSWDASGPDSRDYRITYTVSASAPNTVQGSTASVTLTWEAASSIAPDLFVASAANGVDIDATPATLPDGSTIVAGLFEGTTTFGTTTLTSAGDHDIYVARLDPTGTWAWAVQAGGAFDDSLRAVDVTDDGLIEMLGFVTTPSTFGATTITGAASTNVLTQLDATGAWRWVTDLGPIDLSDVAALDDGSSVAVGRLTASTTFGATAVTPAGTGDALAIRVDNNGAVASAVTVGGAGDDALKHVSALPDGTVVVKGASDSATFTLGGTSIDASGGAVTWLAALNRTDAWPWARLIGAGGLVDEISSGVDGVTLVTGTYGGFFAAAGSATLTFGSTTLTLAGTWDGFVAAIDHDGSWLWAVAMAGADHDGVRYAARRADGTTVVIGYTISPTLTLGPSTITPNPGLPPWIVAAIDHDGSWLWAVQLPDSFDNLGGVDVLRDGSITFAGQLIDTVTLGSHTVTPTVQWQYDAIVARLGAAGQYG